MGIKLGGLELATPGDVVVGGGAYAIGFAIDAFLFPGGATSATTAGARAIGALSVKYAAQAVWVRWKTRNHAGEHPTPGEAPLPDNSPSPRKSESRSKRSSQAKSRR